MKKIQPFNRKNEQINLQNEINQGDLFKLDIP